MSTGFCFLLGKYLELLAFKSNRHTLSNAVVLCPEFCILDV